MTLSETIKTHLGCYGVNHPDAIIEIDLSVNNEPGLKIEARYKIYDKTFYIIRNCSFGIQQSEFHEMGKAIAIKLRDELVCYGFTHIKECRTCACVKKKCCNCCHG